MPRSAPTYFTTMEILPVAKIIEKAFFEVAMAGVKAALYAEAPYLKLPVINQTFVFIIDKMGGLVFEKLSLIVNLNIISLDVESQKKAYFEAEKKLREASLKGDPDAVKKATLDFKISLADIIRIRVF